jgi:hypothetical protein
LAGFADAAGDAFWGGVGATAAGGAIRAEGAVDAAGAATFGFWGVRLAVICVGLADDAARSAVLLAPTRWGWSVSIGFTSTGALATGAGGGSEVTTAAAVALSVGGAVDGDTGC